MDLFHVIGIFVDNNSGNRTYSPNENQTILGVVVIAFQTFSGRGDNYFEVRGINKRRWMYEAAVEQFWRETRKGLNTKIMIVQSTPRE